MIDKNTLSRLPIKTGVYLFRGRRGEVLYVGKARNLRRRVSSYFSGSGPARPLARAMAPKARGVDYIVTDTEKEALLLENVLIKEHRPRYNVQFRDDKSYVHIRLGTDEEYPPLAVVRRPRKDGARYFGPYVSAGAARKTIRFLQRFFGLRDCGPSVFSGRARPCVKYQIHRCAAPCCGCIGRAAYGKLVRRVELFLGGKTAQLLRALEGEMKREASRLHFEKAGELKNTLSAVRRTVEKQKTVLPGGAARDAVGIYREGERAEAAILRVRGGALVGSTTLPLRAACGDGELVREILLRHYIGGGRVPPEILLPRLPDDRAAIEALLSDERGAGVRLRQPKRGPARGLVGMAGSNAEAAFLSRRGREAERTEMIEDLRGRFRLPRPPRRCECVDISNIGGKEAVGSLVVFIDGLPRKEEYRRFVIKTVAGADDCAMIYEVVSRRARRGRENGGLPDLIMVDGGRAQLNASLRALGDAGAPGVAVIAIAKKRGRGEGAAVDRVFMPGRKGPISLRKTDRAALFLRRMRDEAHRFAVEFHRKRRRVRLRYSELREIDGVGARRAALLLARFGGVQGVAAASAEDVEKVLRSGPLARRVREHFRRRGRRASD